MTKYYKRVIVSGTANKEILGDILTSTVEEVKHIVALWFTDITSTLVREAILRVYVEREKIVDMGYIQFLKTSHSDDRVVLPRLEIDMDLPVGQTLSVGAVSGGTASDFEVVVEYEKTS